MGAVVAIPISLGRSAAGASKGRGVSTTFKPANLASSQLIRNSRRLRDILFHHSRGGSDVGKKKRYAFPVLT
jgi:hypothetical protein